MPKMLSSLVETRKKVAHYLGAGQFVAVWRTDAPSDAAAGCPPVLPRAELKYCKDITETLDQ
jgi:hypothetical protein